MSDNKISNVEPDFDSLVEGLNNSLQTKDAWTDLLPFSGGAALVDFMAAVGTMLNYSIERAVQELNFDTAELDYSKYSNARSIGVVPNRRTPSSVLCTLTIDGTGSIPAYTQFQIDGIPFYNDVPVIHAGGITDVPNVQLYQGEVNIKRFVGTGEQYQTLVFGSGFTVGEQFIDVTVGGLEYTRQKLPLWDTESTSVFQDRTKPDGAVELVFGNGVFGTIPASSTQIVVTYAECLGTDGNMSESELEVSLITDLNGINSIIGVTNSGSEGVPSDGKAEDSVDDVTYQAPRIFSAANRAVKREDWKVLALTWPEVDLVDAFVWGEHEQRFIDTNNFGPLNMNVLHVAALPRQDFLTSLESDALKEYLEGSAYVNSQLVMHDPVEVFLQLDIQVYVNSDSQINTLSGRVDTALNGIFERQRGSLGKTYYESDIVRTVMAFTDVDYCKITEIRTSTDGGTVYSPVTDIDLTSTQFISVNAITTQIQTTERL